MKAGTLRGTLAALGAITVVFWAQWAFIPPTNFSGWDEWLVIDLTARGIVGLPYENRPLSLVFNMVGSLLDPRGISGFHLAHGFYLLGSAWILALLAGRFGDRRLAGLAGVFAATWAPLDYMRLDSVLISNYSGATFASLAALLLLVEAEERRSGVLLVVGSLVGAAVIRSLETTAALLMAGPLLLLVTSHPLPRRFARYAAPWWAIVGVSLASAGWPLLFPPSEGSYQTQGLGFDPHPFRWAERLLTLAGFHFLPLVWPDWHALWSWPAALAATAFGLAWWWLARSGEAPESVPATGFRDLGRACLVGLAGALLGWAVFALSPAIRVPARTQIVAAPFAGLFLAAAVLSVARRVPAQADWLAGLLAAGIVGLGAGRTAAMQGEWRSSSSWNAQSRSLGGLTRVAPDLAPGTFVILLEGTGTWPATFTFHHALAYLYEGRATGMAWGAEPFLYPAALGSNGLGLVPLESIRGPWSEPARLYAYDQLVVARTRPDGSVLILGEWPSADLGPLPEGARYAPLDRVRPGGSRRLAILAPR